MAGSKSSIGQIIRRTVLALLATILVLALLVIIINRFDEKLDPGAAQWLQPRASTVAPERNAYYAMLALSDEAPDPVKAGMAIAADIEHEDPLALAAPADFDKIVGRHGKYWHVDLPSCKSDTKDCVAEFYAREKEFQSAIDAQQAALARYYAMAALPGYEAPGVIFMPPIMPISRLGGLARADIALRIKRGDNTAIAKLGQSLQLWATVTARSHQLLEEMFAVAQFRRNANVLGDLLALHPELKADFAQAAVPALDAFAALDAGKLKYNATRGEFAGFNMALSNPDAVRNAFNFGAAGPWLYARNATLNLLYRSMNSSAPPTDDDCHLAPRWIYNPVGRMVLCMAVPDSSKYVQRVRDAQDEARKLSTQLK